MERSSAVRYTYQDLLSLPEDASRHEILDGALHVTAAPRVNHQRVVRDLGALMHSIAREHGLGQVVELAEDAVAWRVGDVRVPPWAGTDLRGLVRRSPQPASC